MNANGVTSATTAAEVLEDVRYFTKVALLRREGTETVLPISPQPNSSGSDWLDSRSYVYDPPCEIKDRMEGYKALEQMIPTLGEKLHTDMVSVILSDVVLHPSELVFNVDVEDNNARFLKGRGLRDMFPGVYTKMEQLLGG